VRQPYAALTSVHWQADFCGRLISAPFTSAASATSRPSWQPHIGKHQLRITNHITKFNLPTCSNHDIFLSAEESSLWLDFGYFCGNLPKLSSAFPAA
jgi:hypothetical protein